MMVGVTVGYSTTEHQILNDTKIPVTFQNRVCMCVFVCDLNFPLQHFNKRKEKEAAEMMNYCEE